MRQAGGEERGEGRAPVARRLSWLRPALPSTSRTTDGGAGAAAVGREYGDGGGGVALPLHTPLPLEDVFGPDPDGGRAAPWARPAGEPAAAAAADPDLRAGDGAAMAGTAAGPDWAGPVLAVSQARWARQQLGLPIPPAAARLPTAGRAAGGPGAANARAWAGPELSAAYGEA